MERKEPYEEVLKNSGDNSEDNIVKFPETNEETTEETSEDIATQEEDGNIKLDEKQIRGLVSQAKDMVQIMQSAWDDTKSDLKITNDHIKKLYDFNEANCDPMPDDLSDEDKNKWDHFNGIDKLTEQDALDIFGEGHPIIGITHDITKDRVKSAIEDFFNLESAKREYSNIELAYREALDMQTDYKMKQLAIYAESEQDPEKKQKMLDIIDNFYNIKNLDFIAEPLPEKELNALVDAYGDEKKIDYWMNRTRDKLKQMKISPVFIAEISQFEKRFMDEKYHSLSNMFLLYFMRLITFSSVSYNNEERTKVTAIIMAMDNIIRKGGNKETNEHVMNNIEALLDQFIEPIEKKYGKKDEG